jgi:hypothetical protein
MPIQLEWQDRQRCILRSTYTDPLTPTEIIDMMDRSIPLLNEAEAKTISILDMQEVKQVPERMLSHYPKIALHPARRHSRLGPIVLITRNAMLEQVAHIFSTIYGEIQIVSSEEDAQLAVDRFLSRLGR